MREAYLRQSVEATRVWPVPSQANSVPALGAGIDGEKLAVTTDWGVGAC